MATTLFGHNISGTSALRPMNAPTGFHYYDTTLRRALVMDQDVGGFYKNIDPAASPLWSTSSPRHIFDDFEAASIDSQWDITEGIDAQAVAFANSSGTAVGTTGNAGDGVANDAVCLAGPLVFEPEEGRIVFQTRAKFSAVTSLCFFIGFTDVLPASTLELPFSLSGTTYTSTCSNGCGFLFDTEATTDTIRCVGVEADVDATHVDSGEAPVADTYAVYKIVITTAGVARFYINGTLEATVADACAVGTDLCPIIIAVPRTTTSRVVTVDYLGAK